ncbi:MAG: M23 family metallopeptidase [Ktedonobacteraceae bacterium]|nr:M23 family metallopeptidase [Chloroflexota bacterium]
MMSPLPDHRTTRSLAHQDSKLANQETAPLPPVLTGPRRTARLTIPLQAPPGHSMSPTSSAKLPLIIPAATKRARTATLAPAQPHRRSAMMLPGVLLSMTVILILGMVFVVPLSNGQQPHSVAQNISDWLSTSPLNSINPLQHIEPPTPTAALATGEGSCGGSNLWQTCATYITASGLMGTGKMQRPILGAVISQPFGHPEFQTWCGCWKPHTGIDLAAPYGTPLMAADSGQVIWTGWDISGLGWAVKINHGHYIATVYGHMQRFIVKVGMNVTRGQVIGYEGSTGASTGPHVHFMVVVNNIWLNPINYVALP